MARRRREDAEINLLPIMNLFVVLIPFLLMGVSFLQIGALGASTPVMGGGQGTSVKPTVVQIQLEETHWKIVVEPGDAETESEASLQWTLARDSREDVKDTLVPLLRKEVKQRFPKVTSLVLIPAPSLSYARVVEVMSASKPLFSQMTVTTVAR